MRQLVGEHSLELLLIKAAQEAGRDDNDRAVRAPAGREGIRDVGVGDADPRLVHVGESAEPVNDRVQHWGFLRSDDDRLACREGKGVGEPPLAEEHARADADDDDRVHANGVEDPGEDDIQDAEADDGSGHADGQATVGAVPRLRHWRSAPDCLWLSGGPELALHRLKLGVDLLLAGHRLELSGDPVLAEAGRVLEGT
ncbi:unannotated protein [freshwater metagenome]|uniref:Unannotated protein n=1 Tax=freshwater metagenome TaxID=449393 RepID=A0A6J7PA39_9ZZZZ